MMYYEYYTDYCVCDGVEVYLPMRTLVGSEVRNYPVTVYDVNENPLSVATNKEQYISIWNASSVNRARGVLTGLPGPFSFTLIMKAGQTAPAYVIGDDGGSSGIFSIQFSSQFG